MDESSFLSLDISERFDKVFFLESGDNLPDEICV